MQIQVVQGNALEYQADVLALKYAQAHYGVDRSVAERLREEGVPFSRRLPGVWESLFVNTRQVIAPDAVLFVGVEPPSHFDYERSGSVFEKETVWHHSQRHLSHAPTLWLCAGDHTFMEWVIPHTGSA
ncbi:MAG: hypothetical protein L0332_25065 [Chloroflexi bacterium]|nr:hypothetical protein [Chloroflexota bacterium]MCI0575161.1 hypothetical protein [Chloroflexota bacterium]MCI0647157.1 hypothetical protein [Chloroflexota bacterium]MCI0729967.1 hypothetical protein [Chloroflexota bacterium]